MVFVLTYSFDHSLTVTDSHTRSVSLTSTLIHSIPLSQSLTHSFIFTHKYTHSLTQYLSHRNSPTCTLFITRTLTDSLDTSHRHPYTRSL